MKKVKHTNKLISRSCLETCACDTVTKGEYYFIFITIFKQYDAFFKMLYVIFNVQRKSMTLYNPK